MKVPPSFFRVEATQRLLDRAAVAASVPVCLHGGDGLRVMGWGGCAACTWTNERPPGKQACHASRNRAAELGRRQGVPVTFVCHLGFTCVIAGALQGAEYTLVFGPYIPLETGEAIAFSIKRGVDAVEAGEDPEEPLPFTLDDVRLAPRGSISAVAEWVLDGLRAQYEEFAKDIEADDETGTLVDEGAVSPHAVEPEAGRSFEDVDDAIFALSLLCGRADAPRALMAATLEECDGTERVMQSQLIKKLSEILDAAVRMGTDLERGWQAYTDFVEQAPSLHGKSDLLKGAGKVLDRAADSCAGHFSNKASYLPPFMDVIHADYARESLLTDTCRTLCVAPSSVTRMLKKLTGAGFSEVLGRIRIFHAKRLLRETGMTATQIAEVVGVHDQSNFGKLFRRYCRCTPGVYGLRYRKKGRLTSARK